MYVYFCVLLPPLLVQLVCLYIYTASIIIPANVPKVKITNIVVFHSFFGLFDIGGYGTINDVLF